MTYYCLLILFIIIIIIITTIIITIIITNILIIMSPHQRLGGHISFSADPGRRRRRDSLVSTISLESMDGILPDLH